MHFSSLTALALGAAALLGACGADTIPTAESRPDLDSHQRTPQHTDTVIVLDDNIISPCNGENVSVTGTIHEQITVVPSVLVAGLHFELLDVYSGTARGASSGASYRLHGTTHTQFDSPNFEALNATFSDRAHIAFTTNEPGLSFTFIVQGHLVDLPSGEEKVTRQFDSAECR